MADLSSRAWKLHAALTAAAPDNVGQQINLIYTLAGRLGCSEADVRAVKAMLIEPVQRECAG